MQVTFVRTVGAKDRVYVMRDDGSGSAWSFASYGDELPHDLYHLVVEAGLGIVDGIWSRVARGADLVRINARANRTGGTLRDKYRPLGDDLDGVLLSEACVALPWRDPAVTDAELVQAIHRGAAAGDIAVPAAIDERSVAATRARLDQLRARWRELAPRGALRFRFPGAELVP